MKIFLRLLPVLLLALALCACSAAPEAAYFSVKSASVIPESVYAADEECVTEASVAEVATDSGAGETVLQAESGEVAAKIFRAEPSPLMQLTVSQYAETITADDGTKLFIAQYEIPALTTGDADLDLWLADQVAAAAERIVAESAQIAQEAQTAYNAQAGEETEFYSYSYYSNLAVERMDTQVLSVLETGNTYVGAPHPNYLLRAYNLDLENQTVLTLSDVILPGGAQALCDGVLQELRARLDTIEGFGGLYPDYESTVSSCFTEGALTQDWYFTGNGLVIYFNCYEIAPYAAGIIKVEFPYALLSGILRPEFHPVTADAGTGQLLLETAPRAQELELPDAGEADGLWLTAADGQVQDIRVYLISSWINEDTPILGRLSCALNRLLPEESLPVAVSEGELLVIASGNGEQVIYTVNRMGLRKIDTFIGK